jgi:hypothetical protein
MVHPGNRARRVRLQRDEMTTLQLPITPVNTCGATEDKAGKGCIPIRRAALTIA